MIESTVMVMVHRPIANDRRRQTSTLPRANKALRYLVEMVDNDRIEFGFDISM